MKRLFRIALLLVTLVIVTAAAGVIYTYTHPELRTLAFTVHDVHRMTKLQSMFKKEKIEQTCAGIPEGRRYENCFLNKEAELFTLDKLTMTGIVLEATAGIGVLTNDRIEAKKTENEKLLTRIDFLILRHTIRSLQALRAYKPTFPQEEKMKTESVEKNA